MATRTQDTAQLVLAALMELNNTKGSTKEEIVKHITEEYEVSDSDIKRYVPMALEKGIAFGAIAQKYGRFSLGDVMDSFQQSRRRRRRKGDDGGATKRRRRRRRH